MKFIEINIKYDEFNDFDLLAALFRNPVFNYEFYQFIQE